MVPAVSRCRAPGALAAIVLAASSASAHGQTGPAGPAPTAPAPQQAPEPPASDTLDPASPMAAMPDIGVEWPDLSKSDAAIGQTPLAPLAPGGPVTLFPAAPDLAQPKSTLSPAEAKSAKSDAGKSDDVGGDRRYTFQIVGLEEAQVEGLIAHFQGLSSLKSGEKTAANVAQINRRAREDAGTLADLVRSYGYYDAEVESKVGGISGPTLAADQRVQVTLTVKPGPLYNFESVTLTGIDDTGAERAGLVRALAVKPGDPVNAEKVNNGILALRTALGERGYAFAKVGDPEVVVDHETQRATLVLPVDPGRQMRFGTFRITGKKHVFGPRHLQLMSRLHPGDRYNAALLEDLRRALIQTGLVSIAQITPTRTADPQVFDLDVHLEPAPPRTISATLGYVTGPRTTTGTLNTIATSTASTLGYGTGEGVTAEVDWTHRNLFPPEGSLTLRGVAGTQEQLGSVIFRRNDFRVRDQALIAQLTFDHLNVPAFEAKTIDLSVGIERQTNIIWQKKWTYSYGIELVDSDERDEILATGQPRRATYYVGAVPLSLSYDGSNDLLNPTRGFRLSFHVSPEISFRGKPFGYVRLQMDGSAYQPVGDRVVLAGRIRLGSIQGTSAQDIAPTRRFYSGGGGSVRGFGYQRIGPRDQNNDPVGGSSIAEFGLEARIRFGDFGIVPFFDGGNLYSKSLPKFTSFRYGTGLGFRYYTSFGPIRVDVGTPINRQPGDSRVALYVSLGQAF